MHRVQPRLESCRVARSAADSGILRLQHPGSEPTSDAVQAAGIESALRWYEASLRRGEGHNEVLDELLGVRDRGALVQWWADHVEVGEHG